MDDSTNRSEILGGDSESGHDDEDLSPEIIFVREKLKSGALKISEMGGVKSSSIWKEFGRVHDAQNRVDLYFIACRKCMQPYKHDPSGGTGTAARHLKKKHGIDSGKRRSTDSISVDPKQVRVDTFFSPKSITKDHSQKIQDKVLKLCVDRCLPFDVSSCDAMEDLIHSCLKTDHLPPDNRCKVFKLYDESTQRKVRFPKKYEEIMENVKADIKANCDGNGAVTVDFWSDKYRGREYISVHFQFLDANFKIHTCCLACQQVLDSTINNRVCTRLIGSILSSYDLDPKKCIFVTDSDAKLEKACEVNGWTRVACFAHDLHLLLAQDGLALKKADVDDQAFDDDGEPVGIRPVPQVKKLVGDCRGVVEYFKRSKCQRKLEEKGGTVLKVDVGSRWNSIYIMLKSIEKNYQLAFDILVEMRKSHLMSEINQYHLQQLLQFLEPFYELTSRFSSQSTETIASVWPTVVSITEFLKSLSGQLQLEADDDAPSFSDIETIKSNMIDGLTTLAGRRHTRLFITEVHQVATVLDPRLKNLSFADSTQRQNVYSHVIRLLQEIADSCPETSTLEADSGQVTSRGSRSVPAQFGADRFYNFGPATIDPAASSPNVKQEFEDYLKSASLIGYSEEARKCTDFPLIFWREKGHIWPNLRILARKYLSAPVTAVPSEQIFSQAGRILSDRRSMMSGKLLEMSVVCKKNLKFW